MGTSSYKLLIWILTSLFFTTPLSAASSVGPHKIFSFRLQGEPETLDWNRAHTPVETHVLSNLMDGLVRIDSDLKVQPALAESWKISKDRRTLIFKLRPGVQWSDGVPLRAQDFVESWHRLLTPATAASYAYFLYDLEGAEDFNKGRLHDFERVGVKALNSATLEVKLKRPVSHWLYIPGFWVTFPIRKDLIERYPKNWTEPGKLVTLGPFRLEAHQPDTRIVLKSNPTYYGRSPAIAEVHALVVSDDSTALKLYHSGKLDLLMDPPVMDIKSLKDRPDFNVFPYLKTVYLGFSLNQKSVSDVRIRKAIAQAIDRSQFPVLFHGTRQATSFVPPPLSAHSPSGGMALNPAQAKKELPVSLEDPIDFLVLNWEKSLTIAQVIQAELKKVLNLNVVIQHFDNKTYRAQLDLRKYPLFLTSWSADFPDPDNFMSIFMSDSGNNRPGMKNSTYDRLVIEARQMVDSPKRRQIYVTLQKLLLEEEVALVPLYYEQNIGLVNSRVHGLKLNPLNDLDLRGVNLSEKGS